MVVERLQRAMDLARQQRGTVVPLSSTDPVGIAAVTSTGEGQSKPAAVSLSVSIDRAATRERRVVYPEDKTPAAAAYRMLRAQVLQRVRQHGLRTIGVVSAVDGEGKTLTAINLALSLAAEPNQTVALVDLDLRRPAIAEVLGLSVEVGIGDWLQRGAGLDTIAQTPQDIARLMIFPGRDPIAGSSELLASPRTAELFAGFRRLDPDSIAVVDLPPVLLGDDVLTLSGLLDGVLLVVKERQTRRQDLLRVLELLGPTRVLGTLLNDSVDSEDRAY